VAKESAIKSRFLNLLKNKKLIYPILVGILFIFILANNYHWLTLDHEVPGKSMAGQAATAYRYYHYLKKSDFVSFFLREQEKIDPYPPLPYQFTSVFFLFSGSGNRNLILSQALFWLILVFSSYFLGAHLWNEDVGLLAAIASFLFPLVTNTSRTYHLDLPCAAMVALSLLCLFYSDTFKEPRWTIAFFIAFSTAMLTKWSSVFFIIPPYLYYFGSFMKSTFKDKKSFWLTTASLFFIILSVTFLFIYKHFNIIKFPEENGKLLVMYLKNLAPLIIMMIVVCLLPFRDIRQKRFVQGVVLFFLITEHFYGFCVTNLIQYMDVVRQCSVREGDIGQTYLFFRLFAFDFLGIIRTVMLLAGLIWYAFCREKSIDKTVFIMGFISSALILYIIPDKELRYFVPMIPYTAILTTFWIINIKWKILRIPIISFFLILSLYGMAGHRIINFIYNPTHVIDYVHKHNLGVFSNDPNPRDLKLSKIGEILHRNTEGENSIIFLKSDLILFPDSFSLAPLTYMLHTETFLFEPVNFPGGPEELDEFNQRKYEFFLRPTGGEIKYSEEKKYKYSNLLILYFQKKDEDKDRRAECLEILKSRGFEGEPADVESLELTDNYVMYVLRMKLDPPMSDEKMIPVVRQP